MLWPTWFRSGNYLSTLIRISGGFTLQINIKHHVKQQSLAWQPLPLFPPLSISNVNLYTVHVM